MIDLPPCVRPGILCALSLCLLLAPSRAGAEETLITPCRLLDTREPGEGPALVGQTTRDVMVRGVCGIPDRATGITYNATIVNADAPGFLTLHPSDAALPEASSLNFAAGEVRGNSGVVKLGATAPSLSAFLATNPGSQTAHLVLDVTGYHEPSGAIAVSSALTKTAFVTSATFDADLITAASESFGCPGSGGVTAADCICQESANLAGLSGTYLAWIADNTATTAPATRFTQSTQPYVRTDFAVLATDWADLVDGSIAVPLDRTEFGTAVTGNPNVWTNVFTDGTQFNNVNTCADWSSPSSGAPHGIFGESGATDGDWTSPAFAFTCFTSLHLYCFEQ